MISIDTPIPGYDNWYIIQEGKTNKYNIGHCPNPSAVLDSLRISNTNILTLIACWVYDCELKDIYSQFRIEGDWFELDDDTITALIKDFTQRGYPNDLMLLPDGTLTGLCSPNELIIHDLSVSKPKILKGMSKHGTSITYITSLSDGRVIIFYKDNFFRLVNPTSGRIQQFKLAIKSTQYTIYVINDQIITMYDKCVEVWNLKGQYMSNIPFKELIGIAYITSLNGKLVIGMCDGTIKILIYTDGMFCIERILSGHTGPITDIKMFPNGDIVSSSQDTTIRVWRGMTCTAVLKGHTQSVTKLLLTGKIISMSKDLTIKVWNVEGVCDGTLEGPKDTIMDMNLTSYGIIAISMDGNVYNWNLIAGKLQIIPDLIKGNSSLIKHPNGKIIVYNGDKIMTLNIS